MQSMMMRSVPGAVRGCQMPALSAARASSALGPVLAPVRSYQGASRWKWAFRPDLRDKKPEAAATPEEKRALLKEGADWWREVSPDLISERLSKMMTKESHRLPNGGIRLGIVKVLLHLAQSPEHVRVAVHALTVYQDRNPQAVLEQEFATLVVAASIRAGAPELGAAFIQMTWLKIWPSRRAVNMLLSAYATIAERLILGRLAAGLPMSYPTQVAPFKTKAAWIEGRHDVAEEEAEEEEAEEEAEAEPVAGAAPSAKQARRLQHFVDAFMALYRDLRSTRHTWKPDATSYSDVVRFYAALGDSDAALRVYNATNTAEAPLNDATRGGLILSLVVAGKAVEGLALAQQTGRVNTRTKIARVAATLALGDKAATVAALQTLPEIRQGVLKIHFGIPERMKLLAESVAEVSASGKKVTEPAQAYAAKLAVGEIPEMEEEAPLEEAN